MNLVRHHSLHGSYEMDRPRGSGQGILSTKTGRLEAALGQKRTSKHVRAMSVGTRKIPLGTVVVDDAHACLTTATEQFSIRITEESLYDQLLSLFEDDLKGQSASGLLDIKARDPQAVMAVPCGSRTSMGFCCPLTPATGLACTVFAPRASRASARSRQRTGGLRRYPAVYP